MAELYLMIVATSNVGLRGAACVWCLREVQFEIASSKEFRNLCESCRIGVEVQVYGQCAVCALNHNPGCAGTPDADAGCDASSECGVCQIPLMPRASLPARETEIASA